MKDFNLILFLGILLTISGCGTLENAVTDNPLVRPAPPNQSGGYLKAGPVTDVEKGPGQRTLLKEFVETKEELEKAKNKIVKLEKELKLLREELDKKNKALKEERLSKEALQAERDKAYKALREREIQLLDMALEKAKLEKELIKERIKAMEKAINEAQKQKGKD